MNEALKLIFGESIREKEYNFPTGTPNYIRHGYDVVELIWNQKTCLLVKPKNNDWNLATLKKQLKMIEKICGLVAVANLERITALQRTNLIESSIAFVSGKGQVFIPSWGSYFETKILNPPKVSPFMTVAAQLVYLFLYYQSAKKNYSCKSDAACPGFTYFETHLYKGNPSTSFVETGFRVGRKNC